MSGARHRRKGDRLEREIGERQAHGVHAERYLLSGAARTRCLSRSSAQSGLGILRRCHRSTCSAASTAFCARSSCALTKRTVNHSRNATSRTEEARTREASVGPALSSPLHASI
jgi:hypothetical protein